MSEEYSLQPVLKPKTNIPVEFTKLFDTCKTFTGKFSPVAYVTSISLLNSASGVLKGIASDYPAGTRMTFFPSARVANMMDKYPAGTTLTLLKKEEWSKSLNKNIILYELTKKGDVSPHTSPQSNNNAKTFTPTALEQKLLDRARKHPSLPKFKSDFTYWSKVCWDSLNPLGEYSPERTAELHKLL